MRQSVQGDKKYYVIESHLWKHTHLFLTLLETIQSVATSGTASWTPMILQYFFFCRRQRSLKFASSCCCNWNKCSWHAPLISYDAIHAPDVFTFFTCFNQSCHCLLKVKLCGENDELLKLSLGHMHAKRNLQLLRGEIGVSFTILLRKPDDRKWQCQLKKKRAMIETMIFAKFSLQIFIMGKFQLGWSKTQQTKSEVSNWYL